MSIKDQLDAYYVTREQFADHTERLTALASGLSAVQFAAGMNDKKSLRNRVGHLELKLMPENIVIDGVYARLTKLESQIAEFQKTTAPDVDVDRDILQRIAKLEQEAGISDSVESHSTTRQRIAAVERSLAATKDRLDAKDFVSRNEAVIRGHQPPAASPSDSCGHKDCKMFRSCIQTWTDEDLERATRSASVADMLKYSILVEEANRRMQSSAPQSVSVNRTVFNDDGSVEVNGKRYSSKEYGDLIEKTLNQLYASATWDGAKKVIEESQVTQSLRRITPDQVGGLLYLVLEHEGEMDIMNLLTEADHDAIFDLLTTYINAHFLGAEKSNATEGE